MLSPVPRARLALPVAALLPLVLAACGGRSLVTGAHHCSRMSDGAVRCWGFNDYGQLGDGTRESRAQALSVQGLGKVREVVLGANSSCALLQSGSAQCWGRLSPEDQLRPWALVDIQQARSLAAGDRAVCAALEGGEVLCLEPDRTRPSTIPGLQGAVSLDLSPSRNGSGGCALMPDDRALCWDELPMKAPPAVHVQGLGPLRQVAVGGRERCVLTQAGRVHCWPTLETRETPAPTGGRPAEVPGLEGVSSIALGEAHGCALLRDETVQCWGFNASGQVGRAPDDPSCDGPDSTCPKPAAVAGLRGVQALELGGGHSCARMRDRSLQCWGQNHLGQLGDGGDTDRWEPRVVRPVAPPAE